MFHVGTVKYEMLRTNLSNMFHKVLVYIADFNGC
jgi:hypothetical protein